MAPTSEWLIIEKGYKFIKNKCVLEDINICLESGKIYGLIGENGSGKTMLLRAISGLMSLSTGTLSYVPEKPTMGVIIENSGFLENFSGVENLKMLADIRKVICLSDIFTTMRLVGLNPDNRSKVKTYSLGMKQKLAIAQAVMEKPQVLILDEPFRGLDNTSCHKIYRILLDYQEQGGTVILATHDLNDIEQLCNIVFKMENGHISLHNVNSSLH